MTDLLSLNLSILTTVGSTSRATASTCIQCTKESALHAQRAILTAFGKLWTSYKKTFHLL